MCQELSEGKDCQNRPILEALKKLCMGLQKLAKVEPDVPLSAAIPGSLRPVKQSVEKRGRSPLSEKSLFSLRQELFAQHEVGPVLVMVCTSKVINKVNSTQSGDAAMASSQCIVIEDHSKADCFGRA